MADLMQQARELLAVEYEREGRAYFAHSVRTKHALSETAAIAAIAAALHAAPEGFVLVPMVPTPEMDAHGRHALSKNGVDSVDESDALVCWSAMLASRPQGVSHG